MNLIKEKKMLKKIYSSIGVILFLVTSLSFGANSLVYGIVGVNPLPLLKKLHADEIKVLQTATKESVTSKSYPSHMALIQAIEQSPNYLSFVFVKPVLNPSMAKLKSWKRVAQVLEVDPGNSKVKNTYNAYVIVEKNSNISRMNDLANKTVVYYDDQSVSNYIVFKQVLANKHINGVRWVKAKNVGSALQMIKSGKADAMSIWHNLFLSQHNTKSFKIIDKINNLTTSSLYVNSNTLSAQQIANIKQLLKTIKPQANSPFYYKVC